MYDYAHPLSDAIECVTHSLCTLEFEDHRPLYDWVVANTSVPCKPRQIEFARLNLDYTVMSKRKLTQLVSEGHVSGWDDPRMPTIAGLRRRGFTPAAIRDFCERIGITKSDNRVEMALLESCIREDLDPTALRRMVVTDPLKVVISNWAEGHWEELHAPNHPKDESLGRRTLRLGREIYIERDDFMEDPPKGFKRLTPGGEVRLRNAYTIICDEVIKDAQGNILELRCHYDPDTLGRNPEGRKVRGVVHWVAVDAALPVEVRLYDRLFHVADPEADRAHSFLEFMNPESLRVVQGLAEPSLAEADAEQRFQFERQGYFCRDRADASDGRPVFNRVVTLRDSWGKG
jgi:glutaminyl-tRNA synthetase